jgi:cysteine desulfurase
MSELRHVYLDYNATTPIHPQVWAFMQSSMGDFANASSMHEAGRRAKADVDEARRKVAELINAESPRSIIFTSGGSESNNTVFQTMFEQFRKRPQRNKVITTAIEHPCVINSAKRLAELGLEVVFLPVDSLGVVDLAAYRAALDGSVLLVSIMAANNEIGTIQDIPVLARMAKEVGAFFHTDAVQAVGKTVVDVQAWGVDYLTMSAHKIYGPKGVGALYLKTGSPLDPLIRGGHQELGYRAGTYNNLGISGFGAAAEISRAELPGYMARLRSLRSRLRDGILASIPKVRVNGHPVSVLCNTLNCSFPGAEGEAILLSLDLEGIEVSTGSACASGSLDPSHVLMATGVGPELAHGSIRFSMGRETVDADVDYLLEKLPPVIARLRRMSTVDWNNTDLDRS